MVLRLSNSPARLPTFFGTEERRSFGWLHLPATGNARGLGVVVCPPFGYEAMCTHRSLRHLAEALAARGFAVLRLDYYGTGDSAGGPEDPGCVAAWLGSIADAQAELKRAAGVSAICLFGLRLGGTLACATAGRAPVSALALWAPLRSGKQFVREVRAFQTLQGKTGDSAELEAAGYPVSEETAADLGALDLGALATRPAERVLLLERDDLTSTDERLGAHLASLGTQVESRQLRGYAAMMRDANDSEVPEAVIASLGDWLEALPAPPAGIQPAVPSSRTARLRQGNQTLVETPVSFGSEGHLFGMLTSREGCPDSALPPLLFLSVGANHHIGPNRMWVVQARNLAAAGHRVLRFDVGGIGDSRPKSGQTENQLYALDSVADVRDAMTLAGASAELGAGLIGICSGAFLAFHTAAKDPRVSGMALMNQQTYFWQEGQSLALVMRQSVKSSRFYQRTLFDWTTWRRLLRGEINVASLASALGRATRRRSRRLVESLRSVAGGGPWERSEVARRLGEYLGRGGRLLLLFSDTDGGIDLMEEHLGKSAKKLSSHKGLELVIVDGADHTFSPVQSQRELEHRLSTWVRSLR